MILNLRVAFLVYILSHIIGRRSLACFINSSDIINIKLQFNAFIYTSIEHKF